MVVPCAIILWRRVVRTRLHRRSLRDVDAIHAMHPVCFCPVHHKRRRLRLRVHHGSFVGRIRWGQWCRYSRRRHSRSINSFEGA